MSDFRSVDAVLMPWAQRHELHVYARDRDPPLRSIIAYYWRGSRHESAGHMWLDGPDASGRFTVHGAAPGWHIDKAAPVDDLESTLEAVYQTMVARPTWD